MRRKGTIHLNVLVTPKLKQDSMDKRKEAEDSQSRTRELSPAWHKRSKSHFLKKVNDSYGFYKGDNIDRQQFV